VNEFTEAFQKLLEDKDAIASLQRRGELDDFKAQYNVSRSTPLKCPACTDGSLWINNDTGVDFTCRKCKLSFKLECQTLPNDQLLIAVKELEKWELPGMVKKLKEGTK